MDAYPLVVLANEPSSYRSLLAAELPFLRPTLRVLEVDPAQLDAALLAYQPSLVICSRTPENIPASGCSILRLYCDELDTFIQSRDETIVNPRLPEILGAIDRALPFTPIPRRQAEPRRKRTLRVTGS